MSIPQKKLCCLGLLWISTCVTTFVIGKRLAGTTENDQTVVEVDQQSATAGRMAPSTTEKNRSHARSPEGAQKIGPSGKVLGIAEEIKNIAALDDAFERARSFLELVQRLSPDQFGIALITFEQSLRLGPEDASYRFIIEKWLETDYQVASEFLLDTKRFASRIRSEILLTYLARTDPQEALALANERSNLDPNQTEENFSPIILEVAKNNLDEATRLLAEHISSYNQTGLISKFVKQAMLSDRASDILDWSSSLQDDSLKSVVKNGIIYGASDAIKKDFEQARRAISMLDQEDQDQLADSIVRNWPTDDLDGALKWVGTQSKEAQNEADSAIALLLFNKRSPEEAKRWVAKSENPTTFYRVASTVALFNSPADGLDLVPIQRETSPQSRQALYKIIEEWSRKEPDAAKEYLLSRPDLPTL